MSSSGSTDHLKAEEVPTDEDASSHTPKKARTLPPEDVIVSVGAGVSKRDFNCHSLILSKVSDRLKTMLASKEKLSFPDDDPEGFELFYDFISPSKILRSINNENVSFLTPWFIKFHMNNYMTKIGEYIVECIEEDKWFGEDSAFWDKEKQDDESEEDQKARLKTRRDLFDTLVSIFVKLASLPGTKSLLDDIECELTALMEDLTNQTNDLFDLKVIKSLLNLMKLQVDESGIILNEDCHKKLCAAFKTILSGAHIPILTQEMVESDAFPALVHACKEKNLILVDIIVKMEQVKKELKKEAEEYKSAAQRLLSTVIYQYPTRLYRRLPGGRRMEYDRRTIDECGLQEYKKIVPEDFEAEEANKDFQLLEIPKPYH